MRVLKVVCIFLAVATIDISFGSLKAQTPPETAQPKVIALPGIPRWTGDLDGMLKRRVVRVLVPHSRTLFFQDKGTVRGAAAEIAIEFENWLNKRYGKKPFKIQVALVPTPRDKLIEGLRRGKGDIIAANLTVTPERSALVEFARPWGTNIKEVLVLGPSAPAIASIEELGGHEIRVRKSSSYHTHLVALNERLAREKHPQVKIVPADESLEDEDLMEMVNAGLLPWAIVDSHKAALWSAIYENLKVREDLAFNEGGAIAWAFRKNSPALAKELDEFTAANVGKPFLSDVMVRYFKSGKTVKNALASDDKGKFERLVGHFKLYGSRFAIDPFLLAAQGYQESGFDQSMKMRSGAVGIMQIKPSTAREKEVGIQDVVTRAEDNIHAGAKYLRFLANRYVSGTSVDEFNKVLMALAAYNAGPGNLKKFREFAKSNGLDSNKWFGNVENGAAAIVGRETVQYIGNIYKYYLIYSELIPERKDKN